MIRGCVHLLLQFKLHVLSKDADAMQYISRPREYANHRYYTQETRSTR